MTVERGVVTVRDHGPGIAPRDLPHVFDRFYRSQEARALPGSGLGLAIVRHVAELHGGTVSAGNADGGGACLTLDLTAALTTDAPELFAEPAEERALPARAGLTALRDKSILRGASRFSYGGRVSCRSARGRRPMPQGAASARCESIATSPARPNTPAGRAASHTSRGYRVGPGKPCAEMARRLIAGVIAAAALLGAAACGGGAAGAQDSASPGSAPSRRRRNPRRRAGGRPSRRRRRPRVAASYRVGVETAFGFTSGFDPTGEYLDQRLGDLLEPARCERSSNYRHVAGPAGNEVIPDLAEALARGVGGRAHLHVPAQGRHPLRPAPRREITSEDIAYAFERIGTPSLVAQYGFYYTVIEGMAQFTDGKADSISGIETPDDKTIVFHLTGRPATSSTCPPWPRPLRCRERSPGVSTRRATTAAT